MSVDAIWLALGTVPKSVAAERAADYVGSFYEGVRCDEINPGAWPQSV